MNERPTPETDAMWEKWSDDRLPNGQFRYGPLDLAIHARRLERQRDEAQEHAANAEASLKMAINSANARQSETEHAMRQRDGLLEALVELRDWYLENTGLPAAKANGAIAAVKGGRDV
jgi:hypothetical protein